MHLLTEPGQPGIVIDFIGNRTFPSTNSLLHPNTDSSFFEIERTPSTLRLVMLDFIVYLFQIVRVLITSSLSSQLLLNGTVITTLAVPPALASAIGAESVTLMLPPREGGGSSADGGEDTSDDLFYHNDLVVDIGLSTSIRNVMYADMEDPTTARDGSHNLPV